MIELKDYQKQQIDKASKNWFYQMGMGTGKTYTALFHYIKHSKQPLVVIAPKAVVKFKNWEKSAKEVGLKEIYVVTHDMFSKHLDGFISINPFVIVDEAHKFKNVGTKRSKAMSKLLHHCDGFVMLSGTPSNKTWDDFEMYANYFGLVDNRKQWRDKFCVPMMYPWSNYPIYEVGKNEDVLQSWWNSISSDPITVADLPEPIEEAVEFKASKDYTKSKYSYQNDDRMLFENHVQRRVWQRKNASLEKYVWIKEFLDNTEAKTIVYYNFNDELDNLITIADKLKIKYGQINGHEVQYENTDVVFVQYQSGGAGIELIDYTNSIYLSPPDSFINFEQSKFRNYRIGQKKNVARYYLKAKATIDMDIYHSLDNKQDFDINSYED